MAKIRICGGQLVNNFGRGIATSSPAADPLYPLSALGDGDAGSPFRFGSLGFDPYIQIDTDYMLGSGDFEIWPGPDGWTQLNTGTGAITQETSIVANGASAARLAAGTGTAVMYKDIQVPAGQTMQVWCVLYGGGAPAANVRVQVQNLQTYQWLTGAGAWQASETEVASKNTTGYFATNLAFTVQSLLACGQDVVTIRIIVRNDVATSVGYADFLRLIPGVDFASVHGHNIDPGNVVTLVSDDSSTFGTAVTRATFTKARPSFYAVLGAIVYARFWRIKIVGINAPASGAIYIGEPVLAQQLGLARGSNFPIRTDWQMPQARMRSASRRQYVYNWSRDHLRTVTFPFSYRNLAQHQEARDEIVRRTAGGLYPITIVPLDDDPETVIFGRIQGDWSSSQAQLNVREADLIIEEDPFPTFVG